MRLLCPDDRESQVLLLNSTLPSGSRWLYPIGGREVQPISSLALLLTIDACTLVDLPLDASESVDLPLDASVTVDLTQVC